MVGVFMEGFPVAFEFVCKFKVEAFAFVIPLKERFYQYFPLGQITGVFSGIAGSCCSGKTMFTVYKSGNRFM